jgi:hypothetical protein
MRFILLFFFSFLCLLTFAQTEDFEKTSSDSLLIIEKNPSKGFYNDYILYIPKKTPLKKKVYLLVEPNNTGKLSDSIELHKKYAIDLASVSSMGNNVAEELRIPLLVPIFPRTAAQPLMYTHALDRDVMLERSAIVKRLDLQLLAMIEDAKKKLNAMNILVDEKFFMNGFSASGTFTNRFSMAHANKIKALAIGGFNGELMLPQKKINGIKLNYPLGTNDFKKIFNKTFDINAYRSVPQFIYLGKLDDNDAVQFDDAYNDGERTIINENKGRTVQERFVNCQVIYKQNDINPIFKSYEAVGHWTTSAINLDVIKFFLSHMNEK